MIECLMELDHDILLSYISLKLDPVGKEIFPFPSDLHPITIALTVASGSGNVPSRNRDTGTETLPYRYQLTKLVNFCRHWSFSIL